MERKRFHVLLDLILENKFKNMIEIGVGRGECAKFILEKTILMDYFFIWYGIDPFMYYEAYNEDINSLPKRIVYNRKQTIRNLQSFINKSTAVIFEMCSSICNRKFMKQSIDLIFIDGNHDYDFVKKDLDLYWDKIRKNGVMVVHDYGPQKGWDFPGVKKAVDEFVKNNNLILEKDADVVFFYKIYKKNDR